MQISHRYIVLKHNFTQKSQKTQKHSANENKAELVLALPSAAYVHEINIVRVMHRDKLVESMLCKYRPHAENRENTEI